MKKLLAFIAVIAVFAACNNNVDHNTAVDPANVTVDTLKPSTLDTSSLHRDSANVDSALRR